MSGRLWLLAAAPVALLFIGGLYILRWLSSDLEVVERLPSPDNRSIAIVVSEQFGNSFGPTFYAVSVRAWFSLCLETKVFEISSTASMGPPKVKWNGNENRRIATTTENRDVPVRKRELGRISIDYD